VAIISIAAKGWLTIDQQDKGKYIVQKVKGGEVKKHPLSEGEQFIYDGLKEEHVIEPHDSSLIKLSRGHEKILDGKCKGIYYKSNLGSWFKSLLPMVAVFLSLPYVTDILPANSVPGFYFLTLFAFFLVSMLMAFLFFALNNKWGKLGKGISVLFVLSVLVGVSVFIGEVAPELNTSYLVIFMGFLYLSLNAYFCPLFATYTKRGREIMDHIEGLEYYISAVEGKILKKFDPPEMSRQLYEELLPYAVALNVESKWGDKFVAGMAAASVAGTAAVASSYSSTPHWFKSNSGQSDFSGGFNFSNFVSDFNHNVRTASTVKSSSSSGGGSSGGGGGGGGGGGW
jgi:hypothetical protein